MDDLGEILESLHPVKHKWLQLGLQLKVKYEKLTEIERTPQQDEQTALTRMIVEALSSLSLTWKAICDALCSNSVEETVHAKTLQDKYSQQEAIHQWHGRTCGNEGK